MKLIQLSKTSFLRIEGIAYMNFKIYPHAIEVRVGLRGAPQMEHTTQDILGIWRFLLGLKDLNALYAFKLLLLEEMDNLSSENRDSAKEVLSRFDEKVGLVSLTSLV